MDPRILSIQSHVVSGYVGNKSATFPLQLLGFEVDAINSVQLSNHTGYKLAKGQVLNDKDLDDLLDGLTQNNLDNYTYLLTGYTGSASFLKRVALLAQTLKNKNPNFKFVCDPVMGDNGSMYVPEELKEIYKKEIVPLANVLTPNQYELELLTDHKVSNMTELQSAVKKLHQIGPQIVAVSSAVFDNDNTLTAIVSNAKDNTLYKIDVPKIPLTFTGTGDLFAALFLAYLHRKNDIKISLEKTINCLYTILLHTYKYQKTGIEKNAQIAKQVELRLVQSKNIIENPDDYLFAELLT